MSLNNSLRLAPSEERHESEISGGIFLKMVQMSTSGLTGVRREGEPKGAKKKE